MTPQILSIIMAVILLIAVLLLLRSYVLPEKYAVIWLVASIAAIILSAWPGVLQAVSTFFGIAQPINLLFVGAFFVVFLLLMQVFRWRFLGRRLFCECIRHRAVLPRRSPERASCRIVRRSEHVAP